MTCIFSSFPGFFRDESGNFIQNAWKVAQLVVDGKITVIIVVCVSMVLQ